MAISVAVAVGKETADNLLSRLESRISNLKIGNGAPGTPEADFGPLITGIHRDKVSSYIQTGQSEGAQLVIDGRLNSQLETGNSRN